MLDLAQKAVERAVDRTVARAKGNEMISGGEVIARMLLKEGVEKVFGIVDGTYLGMLTGFKSHGIQLYTPRHETSAAHMAGAYARVTGKLGVCIASNGPGVANILPGVAVESAEAHRVLLITSARRTGIIHPERTGAFQSFPQVEVTAPMCKLSVRVPSFERLPELMRRALRASFTGRPGLVHLDVPEDLMNGAFEAAPGWLLEPHQYRNVDGLEPSPDQVVRAAEMLVAADRPVIHAGSGVIHAGAYEELAEVAEILHAPVTTSWGGRAAVREVHSYSVPLVHIGLVNRVRSESDLVLALGSRLGETDWWGKAPYWSGAGGQRMIQVDIDESILGLNKPAELAIAACVKRFLARLIPALKERAPRIDVAGRRARLAELLDERSKSRAKLDKRLAKTASPIGSALVPHLCQKALPDDAIFVFDGGNTSVWGQFYTEVRSFGSFVSTFKFGMLGAGVAQALGAQAAYPGRRVCCITGDGALGFHPQEIETAVRNRLRIIYVVLCDKQWGMVKMTQSFIMRPLKTIVKGTASPEELVNTELGEIAFDELARSMGAHGERASSAAALEAALNRALAQDGPSVIHVDVDPVGHMWAPGLKDFKDMHLEPKG